ncbi:glycerol-3-phosphate dehydrogenase/oxidase [Salipiger pacificus]|uniref:Glycerol-3-phosphate dehydrogenase/oxidase n=1 Tax=Salipiger mangrovisoli TaxID=2865933 RepID=A0ABR9X5B7_9RHOB|nr:glycerol-3-phosphate dehydrogenase/oxidase [Salipiger mangrovisoli]
MPLERHDSFDKIRENARFDVLVVGGGINGLGVYRELALQGLRVLLVERNDFCSGCSAAPSRMIHGGLRYLENGEFGLVKESLAERDALLRNAPHLVRPLPTTIPISSVFSGMLNAAAGFLGQSGKPARRGALPVKIGLTLYDLVTRRRRALPPHQFRNGRTTHEKWPALSPEVRCSASYHDAWISYPERLGLELVLDTARMAPESHALNYAVITRDGDQFTLTDRENGDTLPIAARLVVNAAGAWLDEVRRDLGDAAQNGTPMVSGTKGSHLIVDNPALHAALGGHMIFFENSDGRVCIMFPYLGKVLAGSTDIRVETPTRTACTELERRYILEAVGRVFPDLPLAEQDIVFSYSGIRPLPQSNQAFTGRISRGHFTHRIDGAVPQICMVGGKWTTFRAFAEQTTDAVLAELVRARVAHTAKLPIGGGRNFPGSAALRLELRRDFGVSEERAARMAETYGTRAQDVLAFCAGRADDRPLTSGCTLTAAEIAWMTAHERALHLSDVVLRRSDLAITGQISTELINGIADAMGRALDWSAQQRAAEIAALGEELHRYHGVSPQVLDQRSTQRRTECALAARPA